MTRIKEFFSREKVTVLFFMLYFVVGLFVLRDFGVSWDEFYMEGVGKSNVQYIQGQSQVLMSKEYAKDTFDAPFYETLLVGTRQIASHIDTKLTYTGREFILYRHYFNFITFYIGVIFFYLLCRHLFKSRYIGLLGAALLILTPRLFADAVYNSKDTVFLAYFVATFYAAVKYLEKQTFLRLTLFAIFTGITFGIRVAVIFIPFFTVFCYLVDYIFVKNIRSRFLKDVAQLIYYGGLTSCIIFVTYPALWSDPYRNIIRVIQLYAHHPNNLPNLFFGTYVPAYKLPWNYIPAWIAITTPPVYIAFFVIGIAGILLRLKKNFRQFYLARREDFLVLLWFFLPLVAVIVGHSVLYNSWRHMFFIYPAFIIIAIHGVMYLKAFMQRYASKKIVVTLLSLFLLLNFVYVAWAMIELHPFEHLYFNFLAGTDMKEIRKNFETDYWGLTYRKGLEFLLQYDKSNMIIGIADYPGWSNQWILSDKDKDRIYMGFPWDKGHEIPKYFMTNFYFTQKEPPYKEIYAVKVRGASILKVYELPESANIRFDGKFPYR